jgi:hypothetical protein
VSPPRIAISIWTKKSVATGFYEFREYQKYRSKFSSNSNFKNWGFFSKTKWNSDKLTSSFDLPFDRIDLLGWIRGIYWVFRSRGEGARHLCSCSAGSRPSPCVRASGTCSTSALPRSQCHMGEDWIPRSTTLFSLGSSSPWRRFFSILGWSMRFSIREEGAVFKWRNEWFLRKPMVFCFSYHFSLRRIL